MSLFDNVARYVELKDTPDGPVVVGAYTEGEMAQLEAEQNAINAALQKQQCSSEGIYVEIAKLPDRTIVSEEALARMLSVTCRTIRRMVQRNEIPPPVALAGKAVWFVGNILEHIQKRVDRLAQKTERRQFARDKLVA